MSNQGPIINGIVQFVGVLLLIGLAVSVAKALFWDGD